ncbi:phage tail tape measure protein [Halalkalibacter oceani]|uniref:phage tail tape measure protein n=1 Tax=Halalkalibacter oceani TaxID=1653776 RepID=UPI003399831B
MATVGELKTKISLDSAQFEQGMAGINRQLKSLQNEQKAVTSTGTGFARGVDELRAKSDVLTRTLDLQRAKVEELRRRYEESRKATGDNSAETQKAQAAYNKAVAEMNKTQTALKGVTAELDRQTNPWRKMETSLKQAGEQFKKVGDSMKNVGRDLSMRVTAPIVGLGALMMKTGMDFEAAMSNVAAISGAAGDDLAKLEAAARDAGATTSKSASEAADALGYMALAGWDTQQMLSGLMPILRLSEAANMDLGRASDLVTDSMAALGIQVQDLPHYLDQVAQTARSSNTNIDALMEAFLVAGGTLASFNVPIEEANALLGIMANRGFKGSEAGRALNAIFTNLTSGAGQAGVAMEELNLSAFDSEGSFKGLEAVLREVGAATATMTDEQRAQYVSMIAGKEHMKTFQALMAGLNDEYGELKQNVIESNGALNDMALTMQANAKGNIDQMKSAFEELSIAFSAHLLPAFTDLIIKLTEIFTWIGQLDPETQKLILTLAGVAAAIGPLLMVLGSLATGIASVMTIAGSLSGVIAGAGGLGAALAALATGPVGITVAALAGLTAGGIALYKNWDTLTEKGNGLGQLLIGLSGPIGMIVASIKGVEYAMSDALPEIELFGEGISEETAKAVGAFLELNEKATAALNELVWSGQEVTTEMRDSISSNFEQMGAQITGSLNEKKDEAVSIMQNLFAESTQIVEEEQQTIIQSVQDGYDEQVARVEEGNAKVQGIMARASEEKRSLTQWEKGEINRIQQEMVDTGIQVLTKNAEEQQLILGRMEQQAGEITARQAAEVVKNAADQKDKVVQEAQDQYTLTVAEIERQRDQLGAITKEQADKLIEEAQRQRDESINFAEEMHGKIVTEAQKQAQEHVNHVDWETGEILSKWEVFKNDMGQKWREMLANGRENWTQLGSDIRSRAEQIASDTTQKIEGMKNSITAKFSEKVTAIRGKMDEAKLAISTKWNEAEAFLRSINLMEIGQNIIQGLVNGITQKVEDVKTAVKNIATTVTGGIKSALDIRSPSRVTDKLGQDTGKGYAQGITKTTSDVKKAADKLADNAWQPITNATTRAITSIMQDAAKAGKAAKDGAARVKAEFDEAMKSSASRYELGQISTEQYVAALKAIEFEFAKTAEQRRKIAKTLKDTEEKYIKETFDTSMKFIERRKYFNQMTLEQELTSYERMIERYKAGSEEYEKLEREIYRVKKALEEEKQKLEKEAFDKSKAWIDERKYYNQLSLAEELAAWQRVHDTHINNIELRKQAEREMYRVRQEIAERIKRIDQDYYNRRQEINNRLISEEKRLRDEYQKTLDARTKSLVSFAGLFDEVTQKEEVSGQQLIENLRGQVTTFENWSRNIASLAKRGIDKGLLAELREMGPKAAAEIAALNGLTDAELSEYSNLFKQKNQLAQQQAESELEKLKNTTDRQIKQLKENTKLELDELRLEWSRQVNQIREGTTGEFIGMAEEMPDVGKSAMEGLKDGMIEMQEDLIATAKSIADKISQTFKDAFNVAAPAPPPMPSRGGGSGSSLSDAAKKIGDAVSKVGGGLVPSIPKGIVGAITGAVRSSSSGSASSSSSVTNNITINANSDRSSPSEIARQVTNASKRMAMG